MALLSSCVGDRSSETALFVPCRRSVVSVSAARPVVVPNSRLLRHGAASTRNSASEANGGDVCTRLLSAEEGCHPKKGADCPRAHLVTTTAREQLEALGRCVGIALRCGAPLPWCFDPVLMKLICGQRVSLDDVAAAEGFGAVPTEVVTSRQPVAMALRKGLLSVVPPALLSLLCSSDMMAFTHSAF